MKNLIYFAFTLIFFPAYTLHGQTDIFTDSIFIKKNLGQYSPDFLVSTLENENICLSELRGNVIFLNFGFAQCLPCIAEIPLLKSLHNQFKTQKFILFSISVLDSANKIQKIQRLHNIPYSLVPIQVQYPNGNKLISNNMLIAKYLYHKTTMPLNIIIDKKGIIRYVSFGYIGEEYEKQKKELMLVINELLK